MKIFLSAVTAEFQDCRQALAADLRAVGWEVKSQEDFQTGPYSLLRSIEEYIDGCDWVIALVGNAYGVRATGPDRPPAPRSYTQWEYFFALGERLNGTKADPKPILLYLTTDDFVCAVEQPHELAGNQRSFRGELESSGKHWSYFGDLQSLCRFALRDLRVGLDSSQRWREAARVWLRELEAICREINAPPITRESILRYVSDAPGKTLPATEELVELLARDSLARRRAFLGPRPTAFAADVRIDSAWAAAFQVLYAVAAGVPIIRVERGLRFVLIPPGVTAEGNASAHAFYVSESLISEQEWTASLVGAGESALLKRSKDRPRTDLCFEDVQRALNDLRAELPRDARIDVPTREQWQYVMSLGATCQPAWTAAPMLRTGGPNPLGVFDLLGVTWQFVRTDGGFELRGGSFASRLSPPDREPAAVAGLNSALQQDDYGVRLTLALNEEH